MNEKIEGCRTYEEDDDILLSRSLGKSIFAGLFQEHASILVLSVRMMIITTYYYTSMSKLSVYVLKPCWIVSDSLFC